MQQPEHAVVCREHEQACLDLRDMGDSLLLLVSKAWSVEQMLREEAQQSKARTTASGNASRGGDQADEQADFEFDVFLSHD